MRTILVAVDGSDAAHHALEFAARQACTTTGTRLHLLHVRPPVRVYGEIEVYVGRERMDELARQEATVILEGARQLVSGRVSDVEAEQLEGDPAEVIVRRASEVGCDSIVMGTHGRGRLASALLGSVAYRVVHLSAVPVTLVR